MIVLYPMRSGKIVPVTFRVVHPGSCGCGACPRLRMGDRKGRSYREKRRGQVDYGLFAIPPTKEGER